LTYFIIGLFLALTLVEIWWLLRRLSRSPRTATARILAAQGAARCVAAAKFLRDWTARPDQAALALAWERIELPLLQALPDCPPDYKIELVTALDEAVKACANREVAKRINTLRNSLIA
jgi:hypothetical protein